MNRKLRLWLFAVSATLFSTVFIYAMSGLPTFGDYRGPYGDLVMQTVVNLRHAQQGVAAVTFDYRGFDTLGEEFILFAAVAGAMLLLRPQETEETLDEPKDQAADRHLIDAVAPVIACGFVMFPFTLLLGVYIVIHGHLTPGGGFQGGVLLATAFYFIYLSGEYRDLLKYVEGHTVSFFKVGGAAAFALIAAIPLLRNEPFMANIMPLGKKGELLSTGFLPLFNCAVGIEVGAGFLLIIAAFVRQVLVIRKGKKT